MANSNTVDLLVETIKETKGYSKETAFVYAVGLLGAIVSDEELQRHIRYMQENAK